VINSIHVKYALLISLNDLMTYGSAEHLTTHVLMNEQTSVTDTIVNMVPCPSAIVDLQTPPVPGRPNVFLCHALGGSIFPYYPLLKSLPKAYNYRGIQDAELLVDKPELTSYSSMQELAATYVRRMRDKFPTVGRRRLH